MNVWEPAVGQLWEEIDAKGNVSLCAPTGQAPRAWSDREKADAKAALQRIVEREKAANG